MTYIGFERMIGASKKRPETLNVGNANQVLLDKGWNALLDVHFFPWIDRYGVVDHLVLHKLCGRSEDAKFALDPYRLARAMGLPNLYADLAPAVERVRRAGVKNVIAYIGSDDVGLDRWPMNTRRPTDPGEAAYWQMDSLRPYLDAGMDIAFDALAAAALDSSMVPLIEFLQARYHRMTIYAEAAPSLQSPPSVQRLPWIMRHDLLWAIETQWRTAAKYADLRKPGSIVTILPPRKFDGRGFVRGELAYAPDDYSWVRPAIFDVLDKGLHPSIRPELLDAAGIKSLDEFTSRPSLRRDMAVKITELATSQRISLTAMGELRSVLEGA